MRVITENPANVIPNITERDRYENLVLVHIRRPSFEMERIACVVNMMPSGNTNWYGSPDVHDKYTQVYGCTLWGWSKPRNLITLLIDSWLDWTTEFNDTLKIYICESLQDVIDAFKDAGIENAKVLSDILSKFPDRDD